MVTTSPDVWRQPWLSSTSGHLIHYTDADLPFDMTEVSKALRLRRIYDADIVSAYRPARAQRLGYQIVQFGVDYFPRTRGISTLSSNAVIAHLVSEMIGLRSELKALTPLPLELRRPEDDPHR